MRITQIIAFIFSKSSVQTRPFLEQANGLSPKQVTRLQGEHIRNYFCALNKTKNNDIVSES
jgi:hypothetical protein